jgi:LPXTG-site transpeptidase (sortase) family protein
MGRGWRVIIPSLGVNAPVIDLGLNPDGTLEVPTNYQVTGWYSLGPKPGQVGPVVIVGHIDSKGGPAVFYRLRELKAGDTVKVDLGRSTVTFEVTSMGQYSKDAFPTAKVYGPVSYPALRLITCGGVFNPSTGHYTDNVVVYAKEG